MQFEKCRQDHNKLKTEINSKLIKHNNLQMNNRNQILIFLTHFHGQVEQSESELLLFSNQST